MGTATLGFPLFIKPIFVCIVNLTNLFKNQSPLAGQFMNERVECFAVGKIESLNDGHFDSFQQQRVSPFAVVCYSI